MSADGADIYETRRSSRSRRSSTEGTGAGPKVNGKISEEPRPGREAFLSDGRQRHAELTEDRIEFNELELFRKNTTSFLNFYDFMTQVVDYADTDLAKKAIFIRLLATAS